MPAMQNKVVLDAAAVGASMAVRIPGDNLVRPVHHSEVITVQALVQRPANTTPYAAGAAIGAAADVRFVFDIAAAGIPAGLIVASRLIRDQAAPGSARFKAIIHDADPATLPSGDGQPAPLLWGNRLSRRGWVDFTNPLVGVAAGSNCAEYAGVLSSPQGVPVNPANGKVTLMLSTLDAFTDASAASYALEIDVVA